MGGKLFLVICHIRLSECHALSIPHVKRNGIVSVIFWDDENGKWLPNQHISGQKKSSNRTIRQFKWKAVFFDFLFQFWREEHTTEVNSISSFPNCFTTAFLTVTIKIILCFSEGNYLTDIFSCQTSYCRNNFSIKVDSEVFLSSWLQIKRMVCPLNQCSTSPCYDRLIIFYVLLI